MGLQNGNMMEYVSSACETIIKRVTSEVRKAKAVIIKNRRPLK